MLYNTDKKMYRPYHVLNAYNSCSCVRIFLAQKFQITVCERTRETELLHKVSLHCVIIPYSLLMWQLLSRVGLWLRMLSGEKKYSVSLHLGVQQRKNANYTWQNMWKNKNSNNPEEKQTETKEQTKRPLYLLTFEQASKLSCRQKSPEWLTRFTKKKIGQMFNFNAVLL
jgi:hypothetical protein